MHFFSDPILRAPTIGCMLMCLACSLVSVIVFIRKESLLGETLSHATYPGIILAALFVSFTTRTSFLGWGLLGAAVTCLLSLLFLQFAEKKLKLTKDSALCFVLTLFFGIGLTLSSYLQNIDSKVYKQARVFLFGQAATITDSYLPLYFILVAIIILCILRYFREIQIINFDPLFARSLGIKQTWIQLMTYFLLVSSVIVGIRSIGLFMLSGMLIGPAIAARQWTNRLHRMFLLSGFIGLMSGYLGVYISVKTTLSSSTSSSLATGPTILIVSALISLLSLLFAPKRGWFTRYLRICRFKKRCNEENILKSLWHFKQRSDNGAKRSDILKYQGIGKLHFLFLMLYLDFKGQLIKTNDRIYLTEKGGERARHIVRMHRLWELYLVHIGVQKEKVHHNAEEMEHIITPEIEAQLLSMMENPTKDPHDQPIPTGSLA